MSWKDNHSKKPLILQGARQVGKTWLINEFGRKEYKNYHRFNFEESDILSSYFEGTLDPNVIFEKLSLHINERIIAENTLIFFDEAQVAPRATKEAYSLFSEGYFLTNRLSCLEKQLVT